MKYGEPLSQDNIEHFTHGPVVYVCRVCGDIINPSLLRDYLDVPPDRRVERHPCEITTPGSLSKLPVNQYLDHYHFV